MGLDVSRLVELKAKKLQGFSILTIKNPLIFTKIIRELSERRVEVLSLACSNYGDENVISLICNLTESTDDFNSIRKSIAGIDGVIRVEASTPLIPISRGKGKAVIFGGEVLQAFVRNIRDRLGTGGEAMLFHIGKEMGLEAAKFIEKRYTADVREALRICGLMLKLEGWGEMETLALNTELGEVQIKVKDSWECLIGGESRKPFSQIYRGFLTGFLTHYLGRDVMATEEKCLATGSKFCRFSIKP